MSARTPPALINATATQRMKVFFMMFLPGWAQ
jgi:hypothetical protein